MLVKMLRHLRRKKRLLLKCAGVAVWGEEGGCEGRYCCGSGEIYIWCSCGSKHCCGSEEVLMELLRERTLLRQWGNIDSAPAGADTAAAVGK